MLQLLPRAPTSLRRASVALGGLRAGMAVPATTVAWSLPGSSGIRPTSARRRRRVLVSLGGVRAGMSSDAALATPPIVLPGSSGIRPRSARRRRHARISLGGLRAGMPPDAAPTSPPIVLPGSSGIRPRSARRRRHARISLGGLRAGMPPDAAPATPPIFLPGSSGIRPRSARRRHHARISLGGLRAGAPSDAAPTSSPIVLPGSPGIRPRSARRGRHALVTFGGLRIAAPPPLPVTPALPVRVAVPPPRRHHTGAVATGTGPVLPPLLPPPSIIPRAVSPPRRYRTGAIATGTGPAPPRPLPSPRLARATVPPPRRRRTGAIAIGTGFAPSPLPSPRLARVAVPPPRRRRTGAIAIGTGFAPSPLPSPRLARVAVSPPRRRRTGAIAIGTGFVLPPPPPPPPVLARTYLPSLEMSRRARYPGQVVLRGVLVLAPPLPPPPPPPSDLPAIPTIVLAASRVRPRGLILFPSRLAPAPNPPAVGVSVAAAPRRPRVATTARFGTRPAPLPVLPVAMKMPIPPAATPRRRPAGVITFAVRIPPAPTPMPMAGLPARALVLAARRRRNLVAATGIVAPLGTRPAIVAQAAAVPLSPHRAWTTAARRDGRIGPIIAMGGTVAATVATGTLARPTAEVRLAPPRRRGPHPAGVITFAVRVPPAPTPPPTPVAGLPARALVIAARRRRNLVATTGIVAPLGTRPAIVAQVAAVPLAPHRAWTTAARRDGRIGPIIAMGGTVAAAVAMGTLARPTAEVRLAPPRRRGPHPTSSGTRTPASPCPARAARPFRENVAAPRLRRHSAPILQVVWPTCVAGAALPSYAATAKVDPAHRRRHSPRPAIVMGGPRGARAITPPAPFVVAATPGLRPRRHATIALGGTRVVPLPVPVVVPSLVPAAATMVPVAARKRLRHAVVARLSRIWPDVLVPMAPDLLAAVVQRLRATPAVVAALGEDVSSPRATKIWADELVQGQADLPYLTYSELSEDLSPESADYAGVVHYFGHGKLTLSILDRGKLSARQTARLVVETLDDALLVFEDGLLLELRHSNPAAPTVSDVGPGTPSVYKRTLDFEYVVQRSF